MAPRQPASPTFLKNPRADIILRSADDVDFYTCRSLLSYASPVFESMFGLPPPVNAEDGDEIKGGRRVIKLAEDSIILERVLLFCYPRNVSVEPVGLQDVATAVMLLSTLDKYDMADSYNCVLGILRTSPLVKDDPLRAFAVACRVKDLHMAKFAARFLTRSKAHQTVDNWNPDYKCFTFFDLLRAEEYRDKCIRALELKDWKKMFPFTAFHKVGPDGEWPYGECDVFWKEAYLNNVADALRVNPCGAVADETELQNPLMGVQCKQCSNIANSLPTLVSAYIERSIAKVELNLGW
ncbi:hypothetical protein FIBSPDRAFT_866963 [Athelia psychrophila]|uniref:BTB domain-containing protein n=1 Tax=Athelia psychrophila TaxID=1759441 RepID=A0A166EGP6_9AGAM|nr:hypothetical protein FIBSPDRAFT_866963 [Fibularhizoctonia sp. CBS 109695]